MKLSGTFILLPLICLPACKKDIPNPVNDFPPQTFSQVFEQFWNQLNVNYVYWDIDTTNWDVIHSRYKPIFAGLKLNDTADLASSVGYFRQMTNGLIDHHFSMTFANMVLKDSGINPADDQWRKSPTFRLPYTYIGRDFHYLDSGYMSGFDNTTDPGNTLIAFSGTIHSNILFFTCNHFSLSASYQSISANNIKPVLNYFFQRLANPSGLKAVLLDFRDNPGGDVSDLNFFAGQFISQPLRFGFTRSKSGNGRIEYTPWIGAYVLPHPGARTTNLPIYILADRYSASMAEIITMALRALPQCRIIGETTFGATGPFTGNALYDDGAFGVAGFLSVTSSSVEFKYIDGKIYEGTGFPPDYPTAFYLQTVLSGDDPQMDKALSLIQ